MRSVTSARQSWQNRVGLSFPDAEKAHPDSPVAFCFYNRTMGPSPEAAYSLTLNHQELADLRTALADFILDSRVAMNAQERDRAADRVKLLFRMDRMLGEQEAEHTSASVVEAKGSEIGEAFDAVLRRHNELEKERKATNPLHPPERRFR
jgi:hypothetical protein